MKSLLHFLVPLRELVTELRALRRLFEVIAREQYQIIVPDEAMLRKTSRPDRVEFMVGVGKQRDVGQMQATDAEDVIADEMEDFIR